MKTLEQLEKMFETAETSAFDAQKESIIDRDYYDGNQFTKEELKKFKDRNQPPIVVNRIKPKVDWLAGMERQQRTMPKAYPRNPEHDEDSANAATDALKYVCDKNDFDQTRSGIFENMSVEGEGCAEVVVENRDGNAEIVINYIPWDRFFVDPHSRRRGRYDAMYCGAVRWADSSDLEAEYPDKKDALNSVISDAGQGVAGNVYDDQPQQRWVDSQRKRIRVVEIWWKEPGTVYRAVFTKSGMLEEATESPYKDSEGRAVWPYEFATAFIDRQGNTYGLVRQLRPIQDEINKRRSKLLHILNTNRIITEKGAVADINEARNQMARPDGVVEVTPGMRFEVANTLQLGEVHFQLLAESKAEIDAVGPNAALSGKGQQDMSGRALQSRQQSGFIELGPMFDERTRFTRAVMRKVWDCVKQYWTAPMWVRVTDDERNIKFVGLNQPVPLGQMLMDALQGNQPIDAEVEQDPRFGGMVQAVKQAAQNRDSNTLRQLFSHPLMHQQVKLKNNVGTLDVDIIVSDQPENADIQSEQFAKLAEMAKAGIPIPPDALVEASSIRNKERILEKMRGGDDPAKQQEAEKQKQTQLMLVAKKAEAEIEREIAAARKDNAQAAVFESTVGLDAMKARAELEAFESPQAPAPMDDAKAHVDLVHQQHESNLRTQESDAKTRKLHAEAAIKEKEFEQRDAAVSGSSLVSNGMPL